VRLWLDPACAPLGSLAPTTLNALVACPRRVAYQRDEHASDLVRPNTRIALGNISHRLTEAVLKGMAPDGVGRREWLEQQWDKAVAAEAVKLGTAWQGREIPAAKSWPGYVATRTRLLRRLEGLAPVAASSSPSHAGGSYGAPAFPWVERKLIDESTGLFGTPDLVEIAGGRLRVVDLKSGVHQHGMQESQHRQLLLYAHLVTVTTGLPVDEVVVVDVRGEETVLAVAAEEVRAAVQDVQARRDAFNMSLQMGTVEANPGKTNCRYCAFKVVCRPYWSAREEDWSSDVAAGGVVEMPWPNVATVTQDNLTVRVVFSHEVDVTVGDFLTVSGVDQAGHGTVRTRWDSLVRKVSRSDEALG